MANLQNLRPFPKGVSGNPSGRPRAIVAVEELAKSHTVEAIQALVDVATRSKNHNAKVAAAAHLLARGWGQPRAELRVQEDVSTELLNILEQARLRVKTLSATPVIEAARDA